MRYFLLFILFSSPLYAVGSFDSKNYGLGTIFRFHFDESGNKLQSTEGGATGTATAAPQVQGKFGSARRFDASTAKVTITAGVTAFPGSTSSRVFTVWYKPTNNTPQTNSLIFRYGADPSSSYEIRARGGRRIFVIYDGSGVNVAKYNATISSTSWTFIYVNTVGGLSSFEQVTTIKNGVVERDSSIHTGLATIVTGPNELGGTSINPDDLCSCFLDDPQFFTGDDYGRILSSYFKGIDAGY